MNRALLRPIQPWGEARRDRTAGGPARSGSASLPRGFEIVRVCWPHGQDDRSDCRVAASRHEGVERCFRRWSRRGIAIDHVRPKTESNSPAALTPKPNVPRKWERINTIRILRRGRWVSRRILRAGLGCAALRSEFPKAWHRRISFRSDRRDCGRRRCAHAHASSSLPGWSETGNTQSCRQCRSGD